MNLFKKFRDLIPEAPLRVGVVQSVNGTEVMVEEVGGLIVQVRGEAQVGDRVYLRDNLIEGEAPNLPLEIIEE